jgi:hypothetical protein
VLWIDEVSELSLKHWEVISPSLGDRYGLALFTTSPRGYDWVYDELYHPAEDNVPGYWGITAHTEDNPKFQDEEGRAFLAREKARLSPEMYRQEYLAELVTFTGAIYGEALKESHVLHTSDEIKALIPSWPSLEGLQVIVGLDTGADHPFGASKLVSTEKGLVVVGEYLERHKSFIEHASALKRLAASTTTRWAINKNERQPMLELAQHGIYCQGANNDQVSGIERVKSWLYAHQLYFYAPNCPRTIQQMKSYRWDENYSARDGQARKEKVFKKNDELPDCLRYAVMSWPTLPVAKKPEEEMRDISKLPPDMRHTIERMRRIDGESKLKKNDVVGDFFL